MKVNSENLFFTADQHFFHENIIKFCSRPFKDAEDMRKSLIKNWNDVVPKNGITFILGDFAMTGKIEWIKETILRLNGVKYLIFGNHDHQNRYCRKGVIELFDGVFEQLYIEVYDEEDLKSQGIFLNHYPMITWNQAFRGSWQFFGHIHSGPLSTSIDIPLVNSKISSHNQYDVGVDNNNYYPVSYYQIKNILNGEKKKEKQI